MIEEILYITIFSLSFIMPIYISLKIEKIAHKKDKDSIWFLLMFYNFVGIVIVWIANWNILGYIASKLLFTFYN